MKLGLKSLNFSKISTQCVDWIHQTFILIELWSLLHINSNYVIENKSMNFHAFYQNAFEFKVWLNKVHIMRYSLLIWEIHFTPRFNTFSWFFIPWFMVQTFKVFCTFVHSCFWMVIFFLLILLQNHIISCSSKDVIEYFVHL